MCFVVVCVCACVLLVGNARFYDKFVLKFLYFSLEITLFRVTYRVYIDFTYPFWHESYVSDHTARTC